MSIYVIASSVPNSLKVQFAYIKKNMIVFQMDERCRCQLQYGVKIVFLSIYYSRDNKIVRMKFKLTTKKKLVCHQSSYNFHFLYFNVFMLIFHVCNIIMLIILNYIKYLCIYNNIYIYTCIQIEKCYLFCMWLKCVENVEAWMRLFCTLMFQFISFFFSWQTKQYEKIKTSNKFCMIAK